MAKNKKVVQSKLILKITCECRVALRIACECCVAIGLTRDFSQPLFIGEKNNISFPFLGALMFIFWTSCCRDLQTDLQKIISSQEFKVIHQIRELSQYRVYHNIVVLRN